MFIQYDLHSSAFFFFFFHISLKFIYYASLPELTVNTCESETQYEM